jgi:DNA sulfur modification protein DndC
MDDDLDWVTDDLGSFGEFEAEVLNEVCEEHDVPAELIKRLLDTEFQHYGMKRRASIYSQIDKVMKEDWRDMEEIVAELEGEDRVEAWKYDGIGGT